AGKVRFLVSGNSLSDPQAFDAGRIVMLIEEYRLDQLGYAGPQSLGASADAAVMHQGSTEGRQPLQGDELEMPDGGWQVYGNLIAIGGEKDGPQLKTLA